MGKKVNPKIFRMGITKTWPSTWFGSGDGYIKNIQQDVRVRKFLLRELREAGVDRVEIERSANKININIHTAKPGIIIGRGGSGAEDLKKKIHDKFLSRPAGIRLGDINLNISEVDRPNLSAQIVLQSMILDIEKRMPFRRVMKQAISRVERAGALGVKVVVSGRLNGAEIARTEKLVSGKVPLHTLRADIDYARGTAHTTYGSIGVKFWIYKGEVFEKDRELNKGEVIGKKEPKTK
ncbi:MAG: 30S ribosomal protein S3 [Patescibacteria group bacterium]|nr:30S ribosomal protein S3 [Patescibacteria group bacterium]MDD5295154.1 30S ribosomal protein S3 [Patescibacteria group bacterium]MDD5554908.1 30S ribosomal protein S3 [Patescibacteria group bacterium]